MTNAPRKHLTKVLADMMEHREDLKKKRKASIRRTQKLRAELDTLDNEIADVTRALDDLGGPITEEGTDETVA